MVFYNQIAAYGTLLQGWERVEENDGAAGVDDVSTHQFGLRLDKELRQLEAALVEGIYQPLPLLRFEIPKADGDVRVLAVPAVRDRVVQSAALVVLQPMIERELERCSFAYRPGLSYRTAIDYVRLLRDEGYRWVVDADIEDFFDEVDHGILLARLRELVPEEPVLALVQQWVTAPSVRRRHQKHDVQPCREGLPQGAVISPMLANLYLDYFDEALLAKGFRLVRYADDFLVLCKSRPKAEEALRLSEALLNELELQINPEKTRITSFDEGFKYLGSLFLKSLILPSKQKDKDLRVMKTTPSKRPPEQATRPVPDDDETERTALGQALLEAFQARGLSLESFAVAPPSKAVDDQGDPDPPVAAGPPAPAPFAARASPFLRTLYIQEQGAWLRIDHDRFVITRHEEDGEVPLLEVPVRKVEQIVIFGACLVTPAATWRCLKRGIPVSWLSMQGRYYGRLEAAAQVSVERERLQFLRSVDDAFRLDTARRFVEGKLYNTRALLYRYHRRHRVAALGKALRQLKKLKRQLETADTVEAVRGFEGQAAAVYFGVFGDLLHAPGFSFTTRNRRPPTDPVNAMLSFGYTLLFNNLYSMARLHRLNPYVGLLHAGHDQHPALVSDLIEEFRFLVERLVLRVINKRLIKPDDFTHSVRDEDSGQLACLMNQQARKVFIHEFERMMQRPVTHPATGYRVSYRRCLDLQVRAFVQHLHGEAAYVPFMRR